MNKKAPFLRDEPVDLKNDAFGHADYVRTLAEMTSDASPPATVGVFGPWGVGKSTIIGGLGHELPRHVAFAYFDAWRYEGDSLRRQLLKDIAGQLDREKRLQTTGDRGFVPKRDLRELDVETQVVEEALQPSKARVLRALLIASALAVVVLIILQSGTGHFFKTNELGQRIAAAIAAGVITFALNLFGHVLRIRETRVTKPSLEDPDRFADSFTRLLRSLKTKRVVIAVDNLDRCAPDQAVEMLSTIKTYLEPPVSNNRLPLAASQTPVDKEVVFVISVDDEALRRHLVAQEKERSEEKAPDDAQRYVDEYLAKFFSARLPIRPILPDDIREYVANRLDPLVRGRAVLEPDAKLLIEFVSAGLRANPRRVNQFANDLESRLRLLQERQRMHPDGRRGIAQRVSDDVLCVARLALIESEWPDAYKQLERDHRTLADWELKAQDHGEVWINEADANDDRTGYEQRKLSAQRFRSFIRVSRSVDSKNLRTLLALKQSQEEARLPGFRDFRAAVTEENSAEIERLLDEADPEERLGYAKRMKAVIEEESRNGFFAGARAVVDAMVSQTKLEEFAAERRRVLVAAVDNPDLLPQLGQIKPDRLLNASVRLDSRDRQKLLSQFVLRFVDDRIDMEERTTLGQELGRFASDLTTVDTGRIRDAVATGLSSNFAAYKAIAAVHPSVLPEGIADLAIGQLALADDRGQIHLNDNEDALDVLKLTLTVENDQGDQDTAIELIKNALSSTKGEVEAFQANTRKAIELMHFIVDASPGKLGELASQVQTDWSSVSAQGRSADLWRLYRIAFEGVGRSEQETLAAGMVNALLHDPANAIERLLDPGTLPEVLLTKLLPKLVTRGTKQTAERDAIVSAIKRLADEDQAPDLIAQLIVETAGQGQEGAAVELVKQERQLLAAHQQKLARLLVVKANSSSAAGGAAALLLMAHVSPAMNDAQLEVFAKQLYALMRRNPDQALEPMRVLFSRDGNSVALELAFRKGLQLVSRAKAHQQRHPMAKNVVESMAPFVKVMPESDQQLLVDTMADWLDTPRLQTAALEAVRHIRGLRARLAQQLAAKLLSSAADPTETDDIRLQALLAVDGIKGARNDSKAKHQLDEQLGRLEAGTDTDKRIAASFRSAVSDGI
jgi:hypothetical protein